MKYIITENRLDTFMTNYLNSWIDEKNVIRHDPFIIIEDEDEFQYMEYDRTDKRLWIENDFKKNLMDLFGKNEIDMRVFVGKWFENKFEVNISYVE